jgi:hypothetical protein
MHHAINLARKLGTFSEHFWPRVVGEFNGHDLMVVKLQGPVADEGEVNILLIEPRGTPNTGDPVTAAPRVEI